MDNNNYTTTATEIRNTAKAIKILSKAEAQAEEARLRALIAAASEKEIVRFFYEDTEAVLSTEAMKYAAYMNIEDFSAYYHKAAAAINIKEEYLTLKLYYEDICRRYLEVCDFIREYQSAAYYVGAAEAVFTALEQLKREGGVEVPANIEDTLREKINDFSGGYGQFIEVEESPEGKLKAFTIDVNLAIFLLKRKADNFRNFTRNVKTLLSAITDTIEVLDIGYLVPKKVTDCISDIIREIGNTQEMIKILIDGFPLIAGMVKGASISEKAAAAIAEIEATLIPYSRTHAHTKEYNKYVAGYYLGRPGDKAEGDKILKEVKLYKRNR